MFQLLEKLFNNFSCEKSSDLLNEKVPEDSMSSSEISDKEKWEKASHSLNTILKKEIELMREQLANLHQEELSLLENNQTKWTQLLQERSDMILQMKDLRHKRKEATTKIEKLAKALSKPELFPAKEEESCEILSQLDQIIALLERLNLQNCRNDALFLETKEKKRSPLSCSYPHPLHKAPTARRKTSIATYPRKK